YARHIYSSAQLIVPEDYVFPNVDRFAYQQLLQDRQDETLTPAAREEAALTLRQIRGRTLAQWAVNIVDYRDSDATMTRFPYDFDPFYLNADGVTPNIAWEPDRVVWGLEQPELLLTETLATHDVRVKKVDT